jgi:hypothetical protein
MKTSKPISKPKKTSEPKEAVKTKKVTGSKSIPSEEKIREKAMEIYHKRIERGEHGTAAEDWIAAEKFLKNSLE